MPRLLACQKCQTLTKAPDPDPGIPKVPARLEWDSGETYDYRDDDGNRVLVPAFDPIIDSFVHEHQHGASDQAVLEGDAIRIWSVDQATWDSVDLITKVKTEMQKATGVWYEDRDFYREEATRCYNAHGNPTIQHRCKDFENDDKIIGTKTYKVEDGIEVTIPKRFRQYLCYQCPYFQSEVIAEVRWKSGGFGPGSNKRTSKRHPKNKQLSYKQAIKRIKNNRK